MNFVLAPGRVATGGIAFHCQQRFQANRRLFQPAAHFVQRNLPPHIALFGQHVLFDRPQNVVDDNLSQPGDELGGRFAPELVEIAPDMIASKATAPWSTSTVRAAAFKSIGFKKVNVLVALLPPKTRLLPVGTKEAVAHSRLVGVVVLPPRLTVILAPLAAKPPPRVQLT